MGPRPSQLLHNASPYICRSCRTRIRAIPDAARRRDEKRFITRNHVAKIKAAQDEWSVRTRAIEKGEKKSMLDLLEERGYVNQIIGNRDTLNTLLTHRRIGAYVGIDPTAPSIHVGHMVPLMALYWMYIHGYTSTFLLGGVTARVGDPTDRLAARDVQSGSTVRANIASMHIQLKRLTELMERHAGRRGYEREWAWRRALVNNNEWHQKTTIADFMKLLGNGMRIGPMLGRDTVKARMEKGDGMSYAEFSYPLLQAWDWYALFQKGTQLQIGGSDQFGNILAGVDAVKYLVKNDHFTNDSQLTTANELEQAYPEQSRGGSPVSNDPIGFTVPLLTTASGEKFGKSAGNAVWLDRDMTSSFDLYQFFLRSADADVERYLKLLTFIPTSEITSIMREHRLDESQRVAQHRLAKDFVEMVHGQDAAAEAQTQHQQLFTGKLTLQGIRDQIAQTSSDALHHPGVLPINPSIYKHAPHPRLESEQPKHMKLPASLVHGVPLSKILWSAGMVASRSEGQRLINNKGVYLGGKAGTVQMGDFVSYLAPLAGDPDEVARFIIGGDLLILRIGKWKHRFITIVSDAAFDAAGLTCPGWRDGAVEPDSVGRVGFREEDAARTQAKWQFTPLQGTPVQDRKTRTPAQDVERRRQRLRGEVR